jgi:3-deoxy-7-phosphoheptulonate synthase
MAEKSPALPRSLQTDNLRIAGIEDVILPVALYEDMPLTELAARTVLEGRSAIQSVLHDKDDRLLLITGPCSIHDSQAALEYAERLLPLAQRVQEDLIVIMRVYFEKPRTTVGWKGMINDPGLDDSFRINDGLHIARRLLLDINEMGIPAGTEYLDPLHASYYADLIAWGAIGARTTESQLHREMASGLSCPVGFKNSTAGGLQIAVDAIVSAATPHHFIGVTMDGRSAIFRTKGNPDCHIILRGGGAATNYHPQGITEAAQLMEAAGLEPRMVIDCSHANSSKDHQRQVTVCEEVGAQVEAGDPRILGVMVESHLVPGRQTLKPGQPLVYGQSITDACIGWEDTERVADCLAAASRKRRLGQRRSRRSLAQPASV